MSNENRRPPKRGHGMNSGEKAKDFKGSMKRLISELNTFKVLIIVSLVLAALGSILSILAPNKLKDLTNKISEGLIVKTNNIELLTNSIVDNIKTKETANNVFGIMNYDFSEKHIYSLLSSDISNEDKNDIKGLLSKENDSMFIKPNIIKYFIEDSNYKGVDIKVEDKIILNNTLMNLDDVSSIKIPDSIGKVLLSDIKVKGVTLNSEDQVKYLTIMSKVHKTSDPITIYGALDKMPTSIKKIIEPFMNIKKIKEIFMFLAILYICSALFTYIEQIIMTNVSNKFAKKLRNKISTKINRLPLKYFDLHQSGDILSRVTNDVDSIAMSMNQSLATLVSSITLFVGTTIMMFVTNYIMAITAIVSSLIGFIFMAIVLGKSQKYFIARQRELGNLNGHIEEVYSGLNVVKAYNGKKEVNEKFDDLNKKLYNANRKSQFLSGLMMPMMGFIGNLGYVAVCIVGALLTMNNHISFGVIVAFIMYVRLFTSPLSQIAQAMTSLQSTAASSERVFEFVDEEEMSDEKDINKKLYKSKVKGNIEFKNVSFTYDGNEKPTIHDFSAKALSGQKIAIVGPTGAGKTTMVNLLMKFYEINSGDILIDGVSIHDLTRENIHDLFTMVLQDTWVFDGTIKENIIYNRKNITDDMVRDVCKVVGLDHFIRTLPKGYNSELSDNESISSGQKQLLTIARGMLEDAPFLILDEATSNVDTRTEELVQHAMDKLTEGKTSFIIAHRLSTIKNADLILVMKDGNIIEQGNHEELLKQKGFYSDLYNSQFEI